MSEVIGFVKEMWVFLLPLIPVAASAISATVPDSRLGRLAGFVNMVAINVGKAKNDPEKNR